MRNSKRNIALLLCTLLLLAAVPALAADAFSAADLNVNTVSAGSTPDEVRAALGEPAGTSASEQAATGQSQETWQYDGLTIVFTEGKLSDAQWINPALIGPRGLRVGDGQETVLKAFRMDTAPAETGVLYSAGTVAATGAPLPPCGVLSATGDAAQVLYLAPITPYGADVQADPSSYVYQSHASLTLTLSGGDRTVSAIRWSLGALAE